METQQKPDFELNLRLPTLSGKRVQYPELDTSLDVKTEPVVKHKPVTCSSCGVEMPRGKRVGWVTMDGQTLCPDCLAEGVGHSYRFKPVSVEETEQERMGRLERRAQRLRKERMKEGYDLKNVPGGLNNI